ncbi:MAG: hypothetical protein FWH08_01055 [Oscillospiraceae bacterium]|nr:hypothetical protein [Oscillospiraceae bacterium]
MKKLTAALTILALLLSLATFTAFAEDDGGNTEQSPENSENSGENGENAEENGENPEEPEMFEEELGADEEGCIPFSLVKAALEDENPFIMLDSGTGSVLTGNSIIAIYDSGKVTRFELENGAVVFIDPATIKTSGGDDGTELGIHTRNYVDLNVKITPINESAGSFGDWDAEDEEEDVYDEPMEGHYTEEPTVAIHLYFFDDAPHSVGPWNMEWGPDPYGPDADIPYGAIGYSVSGDGMFEWISETAPETVNRPARDITPYVPKYSLERWYEVDEQKGVSWIEKRIVNETGEVEAEYGFWMESIVFISAAEEGDYGFELGIEIPESILLQAGLEPWNEKTWFNWDYAALTRVEDGSGELEEQLFPVSGDARTITVGLNQGGHYFLKGGYDYDGWGEDDALEADFEMVDMSVLARGALGDYDNPATGAATLPFLAIAISASAVVVVSYRKRK